MAKTIIQRINRFCKKYPELRQYGFKLKWNRSDGEHEIIIGDEEHCLPRYYSRDNNMAERVTGDPWYIQHYRYDEETQLLECAYAVVKRTVPKENENRRWEYAERYFIPKEEKIMYCHDGATGPYVVRFSYGNNALYDPKKFFQGFQRKDCHYDDFREAFGAITDNNPDLPPRYIRSDNNYYSWIMTEWIVHKRVERKGKGTAQPKIDKMLTRELVDTDTIIAKMKKYHTDHLSEFRYNNNMNHVYFDKGGNVFRVFFGRVDNLQESSRIYLDKNGKTVIAKKTQDGWKPNGSFTSSQFAKPIINVEDVYAMTHFDYMKKLKKINLYQIVRAIRNPEIEQLINMSCEELANCAVQYDDSVSRVLASFMGDTTSKQKAVCKKYHLTQKQIQVINNGINNNSYWRYNDRYIDRLRSLLGVEDISSIDIESFKVYYDGIRMLNRGYRTSYFNDNIDESKRVVFKRLANMATKHPNAFTVFNDAVWNHQCLDAENRPNIDFGSLRKYEDIARAHDLVTELKRQQDEERRRLRAMQEEERNKELEKKMAQLDKKRKQLNYDDGEFMIILPEKLSEITIEGSTLRHCVGGYTQRHASGSTTIMFLRRKESPKTPFYTIEISNDNTINQIHGFGNKWLGNDPDAIPTVMRWLKEHGIKCSKEILCSTAKGYSGYGAAMVDLPKI